MSQNQHSNRQQGSQDRKSKQQAQHQPDEMTGHRQQGGPEREHNRHGDARNDEHSQSRQQR